MQTPSRSIGAETWVERLMNKGYVLSEDLPGKGMSRLLRRHPELWGRVKIFDSSRSTHGDIDFSYFDYFGKSIRAYFLEEKKQEFVTYLVSEFLKHNNMLPEADIRRSFTHMLHDYGLCWEGCTTHNGAPIRPQRQNGQIQYIYWKPRSDEISEVQEMNTQQTVLFLADAASISPKPEIILIGADPLGRDDTALLLAKAEALGLKMGVEGVSLQYAHEKLELLNMLKSIGLIADQPHTFDDPTFISMRNAVQTSAIIPTTRILNFNIEELLSIFQRIKGLGLRSWRLCFPEAGKDMMTPEEYETLLNILYDFSIAGVSISVCNAPFITRVAELRKRSGRYWQNADYMDFVSRFINHISKDAPSEPAISSLDGKAVYVDSDGSVYPDQLIDIRLGDVKEKTISSIYEDSSLLSDFRNSKFKGLCGICRYRLVCGGSRERAYLELGDPLASDPACLDSSKYLYL
ncbi:MAG: hypothetical protein QXV32_08895 [Conexivisphaerales archaeon]